MNFVLKENRSSCYPSGGNASTKHVEEGIRSYYVKNRMKKPTKKRL
jgi:hypothetical protein